MERTLVYRGACVGAQCITANFLPTNNSDINATFTHDNVYSFQLTINLRQ